jgi:hypothetical protein
MKNITVGPVWEKDFQSLVLHCKTGIAEKWGAIADRSN